MSAGLYRRMDRLHMPVDDTPKVHMVYGPSDMDPQTAFEMLKVAIGPFEPSFYFGTLKPGERPRFGGVTSPISDADWDRLKDYPKREGA